MFMVCSPVYSRYELQKIMETSINSLAFQIPVNPLQKLKVSSLSKLNSNLNEIPVLQNNPLSSNQSSSDENVKETVKRPTARQPETSTNPVTIEPTTTVQPPSSTSVYSVTSTTAASITAASTTVASTTAASTTPDVISTTSQTPNTLPSSSVSPITGRPVRARPSLKRYTNYHRPSIPTTTFVPNPAPLQSTTESPSVELNPQHKIAKIRSRLFNLFQPRPFNSNILHKPRPVDYPTLTPQSLFSLNLNSVVQATSTTTRPANKLIYSSTESYPQIQSSLLPQSGSEQSNAQVTTSSPVDSLLKTKEDLNDKSKIQPTNDNLLAVASSSRFHSVLNSNQEKVADKLEKSEKVEPIKEPVSNKQLEDKLNDKDDFKIDSKIDSKIDLKNPSDNLKAGNQNAGRKESAGKEEAALTGPLNLDEIFSDFVEPTNETEANTASSLPDGKEVNKESISKSDLKPDQVNGDQAVQPTTESSIDEGDGLIVRKISDVIESISDEPNDRPSDRLNDRPNDSLDAGDKQDQPRTAPTDHSDSTAKSSAKDNDPRLSSHRSEGHSAKSEDSLKTSDKQLDKQSAKSSSDNTEKSAKFIEVPTGANRSAEDRTKSERITREKLTNEKSKERQEKAIGDQSTGAKSANDRSLIQSISYRLESDKSSDKPASGRPVNDRPLADKAVSDRTESGRVESDKIVSDKTVGDKILSDKLLTDKSLGDKTATDKPDKAMNEPASRPVEVIERFVEDTPEDPPTTMGDYETTTSKFGADDESKLNRYTYPIEYMI